MLIGLVEHPITEEVTGVDLVELQIRVCEGATISELGLGRELPINGHAIEVRLYAEDPYNNFFPATGKIQMFQKSSLPGVRYETAIESGSVVIIYSTHSLIHSHTHTLSLIARSPSTTIR